MQKPFIHWIRIARIVIVSGMLLFPSLGWAESLKDGIIMRDDAKIFLKNGSVVACSRIVWLVSAADFIQCDKGDHAVEIKLEDLHFEKTFGPELAGEYAAMKGDLADSHEKSRAEQESNKVTYESQPEATQAQEPEQDEPVVPSQTAAQDHAKPSTEDIWTIEPGVGVGWITLGTPYEKIIDTLGKTIMESPLPPHGKQQRYERYGITLWYHKDILITIRVGTSSPKNYSINKYKIKGIGIGSHVDDLLNAMGQPDLITESKHTSTHKYAYKSGVYFTKFKTGYTFETITIFPKNEFELHTKY